MNYRGKIQKMIHHESNEIENKLNAINFELEYALTQEVLDESKKRFTNNYPNN